MDLHDEIAKAGILIEAIPYIRKFAGSVAVVKYGGSAMVDEQLRKSVVHDIALLKLIGIQPVVVHGGGKEITSLLAAMGKESVFVDGLRVTDAQAAQVAEMVLSGSINKALVADLGIAGAQAVGIDGKDGQTLLARKVTREDGVDLGFVGEVAHVQTNLIQTLLSQGFVPVVSPIGMDAQGNTYNINADYAACAIAAALHARKLLFLTDVEGVFRDPADKHSVISSMSAAQAQELLADGTITGGMIPKLRCCIEAMLDGVQAVHILDGRLPHAMLLEIFTTKGIGTMLTSQTNEE